tara:strand:- start:905 stop:1324 length:420 start_codon:yes stop_codon:yes gene_type:complete
MIGMSPYVKIIILCVLVAAFFVTGYFQGSSRPDWKKISPFTAVQFEGEKILAEYEGTTYELSSIGGIASAELIKAAKKQFGSLWQMRIREDIAEVITAAGAPESTEVDLELIDLETGAVKTVSDAEMTEENRSIIYNAS